MKTAFIFFISLIPACFSCRPYTHLTKKESNIIRDSISVMLNNYTRDLRNAGLTAEFKYLDHSVEFFWVPPGFGSAISYDSVAILLRKNAPSLSSVDNVFETLKITPLGKEIATYTARIRSTTVDTAGKTSRSSLIETGVVIKRKDGWKLLSGQTSIVP